MPSSAVGRTTRRLSLHEDDRQGTEKALKDLIRRLGYAKLKQVAGFH